MKSSATKMDGSGILLTDLELVTLIACAEVTRAKMFQKSSFENFEFAQPYLDSALCQLRQEHDRRQRLGTINLEQSE